jgi:DNA-binding NarL/FixJ family response regulator
MEIVKIIIVDDHLIFRKGLNTILNELENVKVVGEAGNGHELLELLKKQDADLIFMDIKMPVMDGIEATRKVLQKYPEIKVIALTMFDEIGYFNEITDAGAMGFLLKKTTREELGSAIEQVMAGESYFSAEFMNSINKYMQPRKAPDIALTDREREVLELICKGWANPEIASHLGLSQRTIDGHRAKLFEKTGAKNAPNLVMYALKHGLVKV